MMLPVVLSVSAAYVLSRVLSVGRYLSFKPFTCQTCMAGWLSLPLLLAESTYWLHVPFGMCLAMTASSLFTLLLKKL